MMNLNIGAKIKEIRNNLGLSQEEFASLICKSVPSVKKYEKNIGITINLLYDLCDKLNISVLSFLSDSDDLFELFLDINNLSDLSQRELEHIEIEFKILVDFLVAKYTYNK